MARRESSEALCDRGACPHESIKFEDIDGAELPHPGIVTTFDAMSTALVNVSLVRSVNHGCEVAPHGLPCRLLPKLRESLFGRFQANCFGLRQFHLDLLILARRDAAVS